MSDVRSAVSSRIAALDGLRGFALLGMLAWHAQLSWVRGGFARMTVFFVLAGYLAARTFLRTVERGTPRPFLSFWGRRARRLMPMTVFGVVVALIVTAGWGSSSARRGVTLDTLSVLTSWSNWRFVLDQRPYGALFESPSMFQHYWSLSVEEQCFLLMPLALALTALVAGSRAGTPRPRAWAAALAILGAGFSALPLVVRMGRDTAYYGTHVHVGEFLLGVALAVGWKHVAASPLGPRTKRVWATLGAAGLVTLVAIMALVDRTSEWVYRGGMGLVALPVVAVIGGVLADGRLVNAVLSVRPLATLGRWAFSVYVLHWPLFQIIEIELAGRPRAVVVIVELTVAIVVGGLVHHFVERPLLPGSEGPAARVLVPSRRAAALGAIAVSVCLVAAAAVPRTRPAIDFASLEERNGVSEDMSVERARAVLADGVSKGSDLPVFRDADLVGVALFGGSTALTAALGSDGWVQDPPWAQPVPGYSPLGCGLLDEGWRAGGDDPGNKLPEGPVPPECAERMLRWSATVVAYGITVPVIVASTSDLTTWRFDGDDGWRAIGDRVVDERLAEAMIEVVDELGASGAAPVVFTTPVSPAPTLDPDIAATRRQRNERYRELLDDLAAERDIKVVDLGGWTATLPDDTFERYLPDGIHLSDVGARAMWAELLGPALEQLREDGQIRTGP